MLSRRLLLSRKTLCLAMVLLALAGCNSPYNSGDRVLVFKPAYDAGIGSPRRFEVVVFKYPPKPVENGIPKNYIKRLLGLPGELLAIFFGQIFHYIPNADEPLYKEEDKKEDPNLLWRGKFMHVNSPKYMSIFETPGKFTIVRKPPDVMLAMRRIVNDNDFQPSDFGTNFRLSDGSTRFISKSWVPSVTSGWVPDEAKGFVHSGAKADAVDWISYQNVYRPLVGPDGRPVLDPGLAAKPELINDFMDYNFPIKQWGGEQIPQTNWVGDLMLECQLKNAKSEGEFRMELSRGIFRYQARFDLSNGECSLLKISKDGKEEKLKSATTRVKGPGEHSLRLANFDARLTLWVDDDLPFGDGVEYPPPEILAKGEVIDEAALAERRGPYDKNDLKPASFGSRGADVKIHHLRVWRDTYYSVSPGQRDFRSDKFTGQFDRQMIDEAEFWRSPEYWQLAFKSIKPMVMYVQPGHYLCLGDNSPMSSDSRALEPSTDWGLVPQRLMLGRALMVYYPLNRAGPIR